VSLPVELRRTSVPPPVRAWVARQVGAPVERVRRLPGASSSAVHGLHLAGGTRLVLRRYVWPGFLEAEPLAPAREVDALALASSCGLPVPRVVAADLTGEDVGDAVPVILMTFLPGRAVPVPDLGDLARLAATIHDIDSGDFGHDYFRWYHGEAAVPPAATRPDLWEAAIELWDTAMPRFRPSLVHRDFHPGNVLWSRGRLSGIVDWANACRGPWGCDVAHCRSNLIELSGADAADGFLAAYESLTGRTYDPYWDLASILEHGPSHWTRGRVVENEPRLARAVEALSRAGRR
jgi:aminoglycoside phosphotransferase (APT) family kinase protein